LEDIASWEEKNECTIAATQKAAFRAPQTVLWLKEVQFSASTFVLKSPPIAKLQTAISNKKYAKIRME